MGNIFKGDIACRIGTYTKDGAEKGRYVTLGSLFEGADGSLFGSLDGYYDLGQILNMQRADDRKRGRELRDSLSFAVFSRDNTSNAQKPAANASTPAQAGDFNDDIPF